MTERSSTPMLDNKQLIRATSSEEKYKNGSQISEPDYRRYISLYQAALRADWESAETFFNQDKDALTAIINEFSETALYIAAGAGRSPKSIDFVKKLVDKMSPEALKYRCDKNRTALHVAARIGNTEVAKILLQKNKSLLQMLDSDNRSALHITARYGKKDTLLYLLKVAEDYPDSELFIDENSAADFLVGLITNDYYDIALDLVEKYPRLATSRQENGECGLLAIARADSAFKSGSHHQWWQSIFYTLPCIKNIQDQKNTHLQALKLLKCLCAKVRDINDPEVYNLHAQKAIIVAANLGVHQVVEEIVESFPNLLYAIDEKNRNIFQIAVLERHANVFNLIYQMGDTQQLLVSIKDESENNLLHLAGKEAPQKKNNLVVGAALQMQRELQWFEEVKKFANPTDISWCNKDGETPAMLFTKEHEKLRDKGETWMKDTADSCTIPATLIITVVIAASITVPGGLNVSGDGLPVFYKDVAFNIFAIFNAISLFSSITSLLVFLSILTSRYAEGDFLSVLPTRLVIALVTLFLAITTMVVAFSCALYILFGNKANAQILGPLVVFALVPIISFARLQFPLLLDLATSTYCPRIFGKQSDRPFY